jgi:hypothetical protein
VTYDAAGNRNNGSYVVGTGNRITNDGTWTLTYNDEGSRTQKSKGAAQETWTYEYDTRNQLTRIEKWDAVGGNRLLRVDFAYDVYGNRIKRLEYDGSLNLVSEQRFALDAWKSDPYSPDSVQLNSSRVAQWDVWADLDGSNNLTYRRVFGNEVDALLARVSSAGTLAFYATDRQGSVAGLLDGTGTAQTTMTYTGYGVQTVQGNSAFADRYGYVGREQESLDGGKLVERLRLFALDIAKYQTEDPIRIWAGDYNFTRRVGNGPTNGTDPSGMILYVSDARTRQYMESVLMSAPPNGLGLSIATPRYWNHNSGWSGMFPASEPDRATIFQAAQMMEARLRRRADNEEFFVGPREPNSAQQNQSLDSSALMVALYALAFPTHPGGVMATWDGTKLRVEEAHPDESTRFWLPNYYTHGIIGGKTAFQEGEYLYRFATKDSVYIGGSCENQRGDQPNMYVRILAGWGESGGKFINSAINVSNAIRDGFQPDNLKETARDVLDKAKLVDPRSPDFLNGSKFDDACAELAGDVKTLKEEFHRDPETTIYNTFWSFLFFELTRRVVVEAAKVPPRAAAPVTPRVADINPRADTLRPIHPVGHNPPSVARAQNTVPFNQVLSDAQQAIQVVEYNGNYYVVSGHHRVYALRNLHPPETPAPATVRVQVFTPEEYARFPNADPVLRNMDNLMNFIRNSEAAGARFPISGGQ